ncbi:MAG: ABC transporter substrate-binding protein [Anaerolinea sp.]|nr:ABC transporter substrate-binding protein [Anaerolinea sp.]
MNDGKVKTGRYVAALVVAVAVVAAITAACGGDDDDSGGSGGGNNDRPLVIARDMDINSMDPSRAYCDTCQIYLTATYDTLIGLDPKDNKTFVARVAEKWEGNADRTQYTFRLNKKAKFADGTPLEAKDVKWSFERLANVKGSAAYFMDGITSIETPDAQTVIVKLAASDSSFLAKVNASYAGIINSKVATANGASNAKDADTTDKAEPWFLKNSAGSGPYTLASYTEGAEIRLARNESYWGDKPALKEVIIKQVKDAVTQRQQVETGDADIAMQIDPDTAKKIKNKNVTIKEVPSFNFVYIALSPGAKDNKVDLNPKIREAVRAAVDYDGIIQVTLGGGGKKQAAPIPNGFLGTKNLALPKRDTAKAKQLLKDGGQPNGFEIDAIYPNVNVYGVDFNTMMQKIQADLGEVGIKLKLQPVEFTVWVEKIRGDGIPMTAVYFAPDHTDPIQYVQYFGMVPGAPWASRAGSKDKPIVNQAEVDLSAKALAASSDEEREKLYESIGKEMIADAIILPIVNPNLVLAYRSDLEGMHYSACCNLEVQRLKRK